MTSADCFTISAAELNVFARTSAMGVFIKADTDTQPLNDAARALHLQNGWLEQFCAVQHAEQECCGRADAEAENGERLTLFVALRHVSVEGKNAILVQAAPDIVPNDIEDMQRISAARELMLEISQNISTADTLENSFDFILDNTLQAINQTESKSALCTIFLREGDVFQVAALRGYGDEAFHISFAMENTFLYAATDGKMDRIVNVRDLSVYYDRYYPITVLNNQSVKLRSTLSAPLHVNGDLYGMICIDSLVKNAFDDEDVKLMEFIQHSLENALANHMLYSEKLYSARHDALTGLYNRAFFEEQFANAVTSTDCSRLRIVMFDLNGLKEINDTFGHLFGDNAIILFARELSSALAQGGTVARLGGDEFVALVYTKDEMELARRLMQMRNRLTTTPLQADNKTQVLQFSYGSAHYGTDGTELQALMRAADARMYNDKRRTKSLSI